MVYAFIIHTLPPESCRVLFSLRYGLEDTSTEQAYGSAHGHGGSGRERSAEQNQNGAEMRTLYKEQMALVARQVQSEFSFQKAVSEKIVHSDGLTSTQDDWLREAESGLFRLAAGDPFKTEKHVVWMGAGEAGFVLVCETHENTLQVQNQLRLLVKNLQEHVKAVRQPMEVLEKGDKVMAVLHHVLPQGRILFMNHAFIKQTEKEIDLALKTK